MQDGVDDRHHLHLPLSLVLQDTRRSQMTQGGLRDRFWLQVSVSGELLDEVDDVVNFLLASLPLEGEIKLLALDICVDCDVQLSHL